MRNRHARTGVYALVVEVTRKSTITVGRLGSIEFIPGIYVYIGSAMNSLQSRIARHVKKAKRKHWHIDYLLSDPTIRLLRIAVRLTSRKIECAIARSIQRNAIGSIPCFGSSDCRCNSHLYRFTNIHDVARALRRLRFESPSRDSLSKPKTFLHMPHCHL